MDNKKIILASLVFVVILLTGLFILEKISLRGIDTNSDIGAETIDLTGREEIDEKSTQGDKSLDTILKSQ